MKLRSLLTTVLLVFATVQPVALSAQMETGPSEPFWRRLTLGVLGASLLGGAAAFGADEQEGTVCGSKGCIVSTAALIGLSVGYFIGREMDQGAYRRSVEGPSMDFGLRSVDLGETPTGMVGHTGGILTLSRDRVGMVDADLRFRPLLYNVQARAAAVVPRTDYLVVASNEAILGLPMPLSDEGEVNAATASTLLGEGATTLATMSDDGLLAMGSPGSIQRLLISGAGSAEVVEEAESRGLPMSLKMANGALWSAEDSLVVARDPKSLEELGMVVLPGEARTLSVSGRTGVATMGADGTAVLNLSNPSAPAVMSVVRAMEFAYAGAVLGSRLYVAAGPQGVFVYDLASPSEPESLGVVREVGFAGDLLVHNGRLYILDRERNQVHRADGLR